MANPQCLLCDSDALIQILMAKQTVLLRQLRKQYGIRPALVPEVEVEVAWHAKFRDRFQPELDKAIGDGVIAKYDDAARLIARQTFPAIDARVQQLGSEYSRRIGRGEAYTFAAAVVLDQPALSHDRSALETLVENGLQVPICVLRVFDLLALHFQNGILSENDCDQARQAILQHPSEFVPAAFRHASFRSGLANFDPRLRDSAYPLVGDPPQSKHAPPYAGRLLINRI